MAPGKPKGGGGSRGDRPGGKGSGAESRDARRAANIKGGKAARDARRAEGGRKGNKPPESGAPDPRGDGWWGDQRGPDYWKARKAGKIPSPAAVARGEAEAPRRGRGGKPGGRPPKGGPAGRDDRGPRRDDRPRAEAPPLPRDMPLEGQLLYGRNAVHETLRADRRPVRAIWATAATAAAEDWLEGEDVRTAETDALTTLCGSPDHQGVVAAVDPYPYVELAELLAVPSPLIVALDEVQDPQNLGAIARTAECVGATGMIICRHRAAEVTPAAVKASAGATEHLPIVQARNLADALAEAKAADAWVYGAAGREEGAVPYTQPDYTGGMVLVMGAEGTGLRPRVAATCDALVALPLRGRLDSLNVGAASAALLYAILHQRDRVDNGT
ncbi:23S rRNA (guanosine(2251)-2'-O)-methyltransferase RlmB [Patulibacter sp.]|uniref:23S rRNA (guanosine(2251)-2'-O)-methyltransferase RlmB n=1 Tax=Patulibacter sp. TaxID=1912859 RepID=UPI00271A1035|nr:23S rRNA (guanosine(2251)-2'-O)-methyltransferase RlmB [Patulibacter sp.]MDO9408654.1 23S rRNA (guanosine(2251)-2'-O)-methyltransferase RlmB [Patulibacter sp.]